MRNSAENRKSQNVILRKLEDDKMMELKNEK